MHAAGAPSGWKNGVSAPPASSTFLQPGLSRAQVLDPPPHHQHATVAPKALRSPSRGPSCSLRATPHPSSQAGSASTAKRHAPFDSLQANQADQKRLVLQQAPLVTRRRGVLLRAAQRSFKPLIKAHTCITHPHGLLRLHVLVGVCHNFRTHPPSAPTHPYPPGYSYA